MGTDDLNWELKDNSFVKDSDSEKVSKDDFIKEYKKISEKLLDFKLNELNDTDKLLVFPKIIKENKDLYEFRNIFESRAGNIWISNYIGFFGCEDERLIIKSRFYDCKDNDYFLDYLLSKAFDINPNIVDLKISYSYKEKIHRYLIFLFTSYLQKALRKGILKQYNEVGYNDSNVRGNIDIKRHIKNNVPFNYKIAYNTRELSYNNDLTQLIRHTIEYIKISPYNNILKGNNLVNENIARIVKITPDYNLRDRFKIINRNKNSKAVHPYYNEYKMLKELCIAILTDEKHSLNGDSNEIYGIIFDVAWLWEEYLAKVLPNDNLEHPQNKRGSGGQDIFNECEIYKELKNISGIELNEKRCEKKMMPDFYYSPSLNKSEVSLIVDAKYKKIQNNINNSDLYQLIAYCNSWKCNDAMLLYPIKAEDKDTKNIKVDILGQTKGNLQINISMLGIVIPQSVSSYNEFKSQMEEREEILKKIINNK